MSVRATGSLIGDTVVTTGIKGPKMIVLAVDEEKKLITTVWFSDDGKAQSAVFPGAALDRSEIPPAKTVAASSASAAKKPAATGTGRRGRPPRNK